MMRLLLVVLIVTVAQSMGLVQENRASCEGKDICNLNNNNKNFQSTITLQCSSKGTTVTVHSPSDTKKVIIKVGKCKAQSYDYHPGGAAPVRPTRVPVTTPAPFAIEEDIFASMFSRKAAKSQGTRSHSFQIPSDGCAEEKEGIYQGCLVRNFEVTVTEILPSGHPLICYVNKALISIRCENCIEQPKEGRVKVTWGKEEVGKCDTCKLVM
jgi:hypothetical protein